MVKIINEENYNEFLNASNIVMLDVWATWCGPCKMMSPLVEEFANEMVNITVGKLEVSDGENIVKDLNVKSIPSFVFFKNGKPVKTLVGVITIDDMKKTVIEITDIK